MQRLSFDIRKSAIVAELYTLGETKYKNSWNVFEAERLFDSEIYELQIIEDDTSQVVEILIDSVALEKIIYCGDGICNSEESCSSCSADCGECLCATCKSGSGNSGISRGIVPRRNSTNNSQSVINLVNVLNDSEINNDSLLNLIGEEVETPQINKKNTPL